MTIAELITKLQEFPLDTEVQAVDVPGYVFDPAKTDTGDPIIEVIGDKKDVDYIIIRA